MELKLKKKNPFSETKFTRLAKKFTTFYPN